MISHTLRDVFEKYRKDLFFHFRLILLLIEIIFILMYLPLKVQQFVYVQF